MSLIDDEPSSVIQSKGPAILLPAEAIGNVVTKTNILISSHRDFLTNLPQGDVDITTPAQSLITPPPSLNPRYASPLPQIIGVLPECSSAVSSASSVGAASVASLSSSLISVSSTFSQSIASLNAVVQSANSASSSANSALLSVRISASSAISSANSTAASAIAGSTRATSALSSISSSASSAIAAAQSSASQSVLSANNALSSIQSSANAQAISLNSAVASANALASDAKATATFAIAQAQASISSLSQQASATVAASRLAAMNTTKFALAITFAILGSSIISILAYYLISRYRQRRREARQLALKEKIMKVRHNSDESEGAGPSLSDFPMPVGRNTWSRGKSMDERRTWTRDGPDARSTVSTEMPIQGARKTWAPNVPRTPGRASAEFPFAQGGDRARTWGGKDESRTVTANDMDEDGNTAIMSPARPGMIRKNTLTYDPEHPERPPKFTTWLEDSFRAVSPFPRIGEVNAAQPEVKRTTMRRSEAPGGGVGMAI
ncbi:uncharacterized protein LY89DRAFT_776748 [Mollisia scopiformis]|uniref:Uncharacterized protein n=1 Tax=Mollisia scopiformis TaxID=149040 RepID=A0A194XWY9_MOLSC|nr:uncharacterized protein LY89DRAFT_776748 [Mollisia scopiformis]KUJ24681.1 hypothetical protein LY89DRAFT_776748 [Mollisia scopiformis]